MFRIRSILIGQIVLAIAMYGTPVGAGTDDMRINEKGMVVTLSLHDAVELAVHNNIMIKLAHERVTEARGRQWQGNSDLLPHISLAGSQRRIFWDNLAAIGFADFGVIGPYNSFDARVQVVQRVFDMSAFAKVKAGGLDVKAARFGEQLANQQVQMAAILAYLDVLRGEVRVRAVDEDIRLANESLKLAEHQLTAGIVTKLDVIRAKTRLAQQKARRQEVVLGLEDARFRLARVTDIPLDSAMSLSDPLTFFDEPGLALSVAVESAFKGRVEMAIANIKVDLGMEQRSVAGNERFPKVELFGNYGRSGAEFNKLPHDVALVGASVSMPVFEGGLIAGRIKEVESQQKQEEMLRDDLKVQIEQDVRLAIKTLATGKEQVAAALEAVDLAKEQVTLAEDQYKAGVGNNIAVVDAQTAFERSQEIYVSALAQYQMARVNYYSSLGKMGSFHLNSF